MKSKQEQPNPYLNHENLRIINPVQASSPESNFSNEYNARFRKVKIYISTNSYAKIKRETMKKAEQMN